MADSLLNTAPTSPDRRTHARREVDAEHDQLAQLLAQLPDAILCFDRNWLVTFANAEAVRITRIKPTDIHSKTQWQLFPETLGTDL
jgi:PAS domain-containing protein